MPAPTAAPAAAPAPATKTMAPAPAASRPEITPPSESKDAFADAFADLDTMDQEPSAPKREAARKDPTPKVGASDTKESDTAGDKPSEDDAANNADSSTKNGEAGTDPKPEAKPFKSAELRNAYEGLKKKIKEEYEPKAREVDTLRARVKEFESRDDGAAKAAQDRWAAVEKRNAELEARIQLLDFETSKPYQEEFQKPYEEAWGVALRELKGLKMTVTDPQSGEDVVREVSQADIAYFANLEPGVRRTEINRLFPEDKEEVKRHVNQISFLAEKSFARKQKAQQDAVEHAKNSTIQQQQAQEERMRMWRSNNEVISAKYPQWFAKAEGDNEGNAIFDKGAALADLAINPHDLTAERIALLPTVLKDQIQSGKPFTQQQLVQMHAIIRNKAANHDRLIHQNKTLTTRIKELEKSLKDYEESSPDGVPAGKDRSGKPVDQTWESELEALDRA